MSPELLAYPFLFISIFFESFVLVTFLSAPARRARERTPAATTPSVAVIVPCFNEERTLAHTVHSLLALQYDTKMLEIILVNDGSTDSTKEVMRQFARSPQIKIIEKENGGKHTALNEGIALTSAEIVGCLDADSSVEPDALRQIIPCFDDPQVAAATAAMSVAKPANLLQHMQSAEYFFSIVLRHALSSINGLYVTPGPFSLYRRSILEKVGGFRHGYQTEDMEMALRLQKKGYKIENSPSARVYTNVPPTLTKLVNQRTRWITGFLRNIRYDYWDLVGNRRYGALGTVVLPIALLAIVSGILVFGVSLVLFAIYIIEALLIRSGIPLSYALSPHSFDWFYLPTSSYLLLALTTALGALSFIIIGKHISKTPGRLLIGLASYLLLYGFVAPLWLMRSTADVLVGKNRNWR